MPDRTNDAIVQRHRELRDTLIAKHSRLAAEKIEKLLEGTKKPTE